jgi:hypothetical protein
MSMHLCGPALTMTGKKKGKVKFRNAEEAQRARQLDADWKDLLKRQGVEQEERKRRRALSAQPWTEPMLAYRGQGEKRNSVNTGGNALLKPSPVYTGTKMLGIGQLHKSNAVPVFSNEEAIDLARMRR